MVMIPFAKMVPWLGDAHAESPREIVTEKKQLKQISYFLHMVARNTPFDSKCLVRAIAALKMLERRGFESTLYLGTGRNEAGQLGAHAWLRCGSVYISGSDEMDNYTIVACFHRKVKRHKDKEGWSHG
ncbi:stage V sporulation protein S [Paenibacillus herberti]|uniref:Stage V sporulation protein S n=2 Tax=Paenibacillus herberti TaxID=1619309 RepID=A0A229NVM9_9BACL|nr:stage V sporulation protein S [Paenibacillus herberti]